MPNPTDSRLLDTARAIPVEAIKNAGIDLRQTFTKEGLQLSRQSGRCALARQFKRMRSSSKHRSTIVSRLRREIGRKASAIGQAVGQALDLIVGARAFAGNPYYAHMLHKQLEQASILMQDSQLKPATAFVDLGYRGVNADTADVHIVRRGKSRRINARERRQLKRRQVIEPVIGHLKSDHRLNRCYLKGELGDNLHTVLCTVGHNLKWLRMISKKGIAFLETLFYACRKHGRGGALGGRWSQKRPMSQQKPTYGCFV